MWERFGFYTAAAMMTLYLQRGGFGWSKNQATELWSNYLMFVYATPADRRLAGRQVPGLPPLGAARRRVLHRRLRCCSALGSVATYYIALALIFVGNGFFKPNISTMVGNLYPAGSPLKDSAYNIFYMGINIGALLAPVVAEVAFRSSRVRTCSRWPRRATPLSAEQAASLRAASSRPSIAAAGGMTLGTIIFAAFYRKLAAVEQRHVPLDDHGPRGRRRHRGSRPADDRCPAIDQVPECNRIAALLVIYAIVIVFWMVFHQNGSTMTYWADENTNWNVSGVVSNAINPFWIVVLSIPLVELLGLAAQEGTGAVDARRRWPSACS